MAKQIRHILVAIRSLQHAPKNELYKAAALAKASGASLELFHAIDEPDPGRSYPQTITKDAVAKTPGRYRCEKPRPSGAFRAGQVTARREGHMCGSLGSSALRGYRAARARDSC